jgi:flavin-dependent dehydrogenase
MHEPPGQLANPDVLIVGGGPAGSVTAIELAKRGLKVLLVEKQQMPRWKVCGACITALGIRTLTNLGVHAVLNSPPANHVQRIRLRFAGGSELAMPAPAMCVVARSELDDVLIHAAREAGAHVLMRAHASPAERGFVDVRTESHRFLTHPRAVVLANGLHGADRWGFTPHSARRRSRIGVGAVGPWHDAIAQSHDLLMIVTSTGYLGCVRVAANRANWAAAIDPHALRHAGSPHHWALGTLQVSGLDPAILPETGWRGTPHLTCANPVQRDNMYLVGDAAGYVEPITGEGISWAMEQARTLAPIVVHAIARDRHDHAWQRAHHRLMRVRRVRCSFVAALARRPSMLRLASQLISAVPARRNGPLQFALGSSGAWSPS